MQTSQIRKILEDHQMISADDPIEVTTLSGGVSSDIQLVRFRDQSIVFKQALARLRVKDEWLANRVRNQFEQAFFHFMDHVAPECVPKVLIREPSEGYFVMEYLEGFEMWKNELLEGIFDKDKANRAAVLLAGIHNTGFQNEHWKKCFDSDPNFFELRVDPYLLSTAKKHPSLASIFAAEAIRLTSFRETVVHGDYSPKNIMIREDRFVLLDHEVAHYGDPAFDVAFMSTHLFLKFLLNPGQSESWSGFITNFWETYFSNRTDANTADLQSRSIHLLKLLMLARVDGKSPVEYFKKDSREQHFIRSFIRSQIDRPPSFEQYREGWIESVKNF